MPVLTLLLSCFWLTRCLLDAPAAAPPGLVVRVEPVFGAAPLLLDTQAYPTARQGVVTISTFRFYLSGLRVTYTDGTIYAEPASYHLIDADPEAAASCQLILSTAPAKPVRALTFCVGVDSAANVAGALGGDLEPGRGMYWAWHSGYINAKLEGHAPACPAPRHEFAFHIGGFQAPHNALRTVTVAVPAPTGPTALVLRADVGQWLEALDLAHTYSVLVPGAAAMACADACARMFTLSSAPDEAR